MKEILKNIGLLCSCLTGCSPNRKGDQSHVRIDISPNKKLLVFNAYGKKNIDLFLLDLETGKTRLISELNGNKFDPKFSDDSKRILFSMATHNYTSSSIHELALTDGKTIKIVDSGNFFDSKPIYSKKNGEIYFNRAHRRLKSSLGGYVWDHWDVYKTNIGNISRITQSLFYQLFNVNIDNISDDLFFSAKEAGSKNKNKIYQLDKYRNIKTYRDYGYYYVKARGAKNSVYVRDENKDYNFEIFSCSDNSNDVKITNLKSYLSELSISNDGESIYFLSQMNRDKRFDLYSVHVDGTNLKKLANSDYFDNPIKNRSLIGVITQA